MDVRAKRSGTRFSRSHGFSMVELAVSLAILIILTGMAIPALTQSLRAYQLNDAATRLSDILKFTRYEAVRRNTTVDFRVKQNGTAWNIWTDWDKDGVMDPTEKQSVIAGFVTLLPAGSTGLPGPNSISASLGVAPPALDPSRSGANGFIRFDARGALTPLLNAFILYVGSSTNIQYGFRAVVLLPSGATQVWSAPQGGTWVRVS
ncbi:MAG TPA: GspH/FimT family pseudopilin [Candidatus Acidoferrum sp.]|nr:GspH/FimT family pseudopilin [Candidatus Acidoferrum sp.]